MGNPRFLVTVAIEEVIGVTAKTVAEVQGRGRDFWKVRSFSSFLAVNRQSFWAVLFSVKWTVILGRARAFCML